MNKAGKYFWRGVKENIAPCCIAFFENEWQTIRKENKEYGETMHILTNNEGVILCPNCLAKKVTHSA
ncbi:MAG: hypothetical protein HRU07_06815 [Nitrosopumilus sp.]|nr:hypothetical protein [Nitrosopumilus sp.]NRA05850.1 hypothetical protein [Nitrosopumilus sp.]